MALIHPRSLERWQEWESSRHRARAARQAVAGLVRSARRRPTEQPAPRYVLHTRAGDGPGRILLGVDTASPASRDGLLAVLPYLHATVDVLAPRGLQLPELAGSDWEHEEIAHPSSAFEGRGITSAITLGWHRNVGRLTHEWALSADVASAVVQHDALTPFAPPLPPQTTLLAWTDADGEFQRSGRDDVDVRTVGSQRLWQAAHESSEPASELDERAVFLGQLTAIELPRRVTAAAAHSYCRSTGALYQPPPEETDRLSRATHALLRRRGIELQDPAVPLREMHRPVVSVASADVLEAAVRGLPAWVHGPNVPTWVHEFWERYGMRPTGGPETPAPPIAADEPARLLAQILEGTA